MIEILVVHFLPFRYASKLIRILNLIHFFEFSILKLVVIRHVWIYAQFKVSLVFIMPLKILFLHLLPWIYLTGKGLKALLKA